MKPKLLLMLLLLPLWADAVPIAHGQETASYEDTFRASSQRAVALYPDISVPGTDMYRLMAEIDKKTAASGNPLHANPEKPFLMATLASRFVTRKKSGWSTKRNSEKLWAEVKVLNQAAATHAAGTGTGESGGSEDAGLRGYMAEIREGLTLRRSPLLKWPGRDSIIADLAEGFRARKEAGLSGEENTQRLTEEVERYERVIRARQGDPVPEPAAAMPVLPQLSRPGVPNPAVPGPAVPVPTSPSATPASPAAPRPVLPLPTQ